jgi:transposase-like protein
MPYIRSDVKGVFGKQTTCICPGCRQEHRMIMDWKWRGIPRKRCPKCQQNINNLTGGIDDDSAFSKYALINYSVHQGRS